MKNYQRIVTDEYNNEAADSERRDKGENWDEKAKLLAIHGSVQSG